MAKGKRPRTKEESATQKIRTAHNQIKKYEALIAANPGNKHIKKWQAEIDFHKKN